MSDAAFEGPRLSFGPYVIDPATRLLLRDGQPVTLTAKAFDVLLALVERRGRVVTKEELLTCIWGGMHVQENNLVRQISTVRRALDQRPDQHDFIVTIPGHGYQFVAPVEVVRGDRAGLRATEAVEPVTLADSVAPAAEDVPPLAAPLAGSTGAAAPASHPWLVIALVSLLTGGAAATALLPRNAPAGVAAPIDAPHRSLSRVTYEAGLARQSSWSPDGEWVVFASDRSSGGDLWKQRVSDPDAVRLTTGGAGDSHPQWSPDGRFIAFRSERDGGGLFILPAAGGAVRRVAEFGYEPRWSPSGAQILFTRSIVLPGSPGLYVVALDGKPPRLVRPDLVGQFATVHAAWHPDGKRVSFWGSLRAGAGTVFLTAPVDSGTAATARLEEPVRRNLSAVAAGRFVWAPNGRHIYFEGRAGETRNIWRVTVDPASDRWVGGPDRLTTGAGADTDLAVSPDGTRLLFTTRATRTRLWSFAYDGGSSEPASEPQAVTAGAAGEVNAEVTLDGSKLAFNAMRAGRSEVWERVLASGRERLLVASADVRYSRPRWSPDGTQLAYAKRNIKAPNESAVVVLGPDGVERMVTRPSDVEFVPNDWSRDGSSLLGACRFGQAERFGVCLMPLSSARQVGGPTIRVIASDPRRDLFNERFSPDYRWIAFLALDPADVTASSVYAIPVEGGRWAPITEGLAFDDKPRWTPDGRAIVFVSNRRGVANVWARRFDPKTGAAVGSPFAITAFASPRFMLTSQTAEMDIALAGSRLFLPISESQGDVWMLDHIER